MDKNGSSGSTPNFGDLLNKSNKAFPKQYNKGIDTYLGRLDELLNREQESRWGFDPQRIQEQQNLQSQFGPTQYNQQLDALRQLDPSGYGLREQTASTISGDLSGTGANAQQQGLYNDLLSNVSGELNSGRSLSDSQRSGLEQDIRGAQAARGNVYGQAPVQAESFALGDRGEQMYQQRLGNATSALGITSPQQQALQSALGFQNSATPESWISQIAPVSADRSMAYVNPNAGYLGVNASNAGFQNALGIAGLGQQGNSGGGWGSTLGGIASIIGPILGAFVGSDARLKTGISKVGNHNGVGLYKFAMKDNPHKPMIGAIAQDVAKTRPDAVAQDPQSGLLGVNYHKLGMPELPAPAHGFAKGGPVHGSTDTVPAMLTPGEVVLNKPQQKEVGFHRIMTALRGHKVGRPIGGGVRGFSGGGVQSWNNVNNQFELPVGGAGTETPNQYEQFGNISGDPNPSTIAGGGDPYPPIGGVDIPPDTTSDPATGGSPPSGQPHYIGTPPINVPLVQPPGVNMPPNQQPMPFWMNFFPAAKAGFLGFRGAQRLREMYQNWQNNRQPGSPSQPHGGSGGGGPSQGMGFWGQNPGDNPEFVHWAHPDGGGPMTSNPNEPGWVGGSVFGTSTGTPRGWHNGVYQNPNSGGGFNIPGGTNWSPGSPSPVNLPSAVQFKMGMASPAFQNWVHTHPLSQHFLDTIAGASHGGGKGGSQFNIHLSRPQETK